jgi:hypothetical protein
MRYLVQHGSWWAATLEENVRVGLLQRCVSVANTVLHVSSDEFLINWSACFDEGCGMHVCSCCFGKVSTLPGM